VNFTGEMDRAFAVNRIPPRRVGLAKKLDLQPDANRRFFQRKADNAPGRLPGGATGGAAANLDALDPAVGGRYR